jgi:deazaflavin-dependent oxidoreductase (nitroreductase family)
MGGFLFGQDHVERYRETDGELGHDWQGTTVLLLTTIGRRSGVRRTTPLIYQRHGGAFVVVASNGGGDPPGWFLNLLVDPIVGVQVRREHYSARARVATAAERPELWRIMTATGTPYDEFQARAKREIPVVVLEPSSDQRPLSPARARRWS